MLTLNDFTKIKENKWDIAYWELTHPIIDKEDIYTAVITSRPFEKQYKFNIEIFKNDESIKTVPIYFIWEIPHNTYINIHQLITNNND